MDMANAAGELVVKDVRANTDFFIALFESMMDRMLSQREKSMLEQVPGHDVQPHVGKETRPTLKDLYATLRDERNPVAEELADSLEMYAQGSMDSFAGQTNVRTSAYFNLYVMSDLGKTMQTLGMMSTLQHVRKCTYANYRIGKPTYLLVEECQILFGNDAAVRMLDDYFSELRKFGLHIICVTQLPTRVLEHPLAVNLFENSGWFVLLPQQAKNVSLKARRFTCRNRRNPASRRSSEPGSGLSWRRAQDRHAQHHPEGQPALRDLEHGPVQAGEEDGAALRRRAGDGRGWMPMTKAHELLDEGDRGVRSAARLLRDEKGSRSGDSSRNQVPAARRACSRMSRPAPEAISSRPGEREHSRWASAMRPGSRAS